MLEFIITIVLFLAVGAVLLTLARALPRVEETPAGRDPFLDRLLRSGVPERIDSALSAMTERVLRKTRVVLLKTDNAVVSILKKVKSDGSGNGNGKLPLDFSGIIAEKNGGEKKDK